MKRIDTVDIFRGIAVLQMIFWQIFDFFAKVNIYSDVPYYLAFFNMPINGIGVGLFAFISGFSAYIMVANRLKKKVGKKEIVLHAIKRYGGYILLSLAFTTIVFGFGSFFGWSEAIQGIGLSALFAVMIILLFKSKWVWFGIGLLIVALQPYLREIVLPFIQNSAYGSMGAFVFVLNLSLGGNFSLSHLLPITLFGVFLGGIYFSLKERKLTYIGFYGFLILFVSLFLHFTFDKINYYGRSSSYQLFYIGVSFLLFWVIELISCKNKVFDVLILFGKTAIVAYLFHFLFIFKPLVVFGLVDTFSTGISYFFAIVFIIVIYYICKLWIYWRLCRLQKS